MKTVISACIYSIILIITITNYSICSDRFSYGIKAGTGFWKLTPLKNLPIGETMEHSYSPGLAAGMFIENKLSQNFSITNEFFYQRVASKVSVYTWIEGILEQELTADYLSLPILIKYYSTSLWDTYFFAGPNIALLINANYNYEDKIYYDKGEVKITNKLRAVTASVEVGIGKKIDVLNSAILVELRAQFGITENQYQYLGRWRNSGIIVLAGYQIN